MRFLTRSGSHLSKVSCGGHRPFRYIAPRWRLSIRRAPGGPMARDPKAEAALALHRFGFGPRLGSIAAIASDPRGALLAELDRPGAGRITNPDLLDSGEAARAAFNFRQERKLHRLVEQA